MARDGSIVILDGGRRLPRADILHGNKEAGLFARFTATQLGGMAIRAAVRESKIPAGKIGHVVMGMAQHAHRDSIYAAQGMRWRGGLPHDVPALTVARICGSGAEAVAVGSEIILAGMRHDAARPFIVVGGAESMQYPFAAYGLRGRKVGASVQKYGAVDAKTLPPGTHLQDALLANLYDPSAKMSMANTAEELARRYRITRAEADAFGLRSHVNAKKARDAGWFDEEIEPVVVKRDGAADPITVKYDTHVLDQVTSEGMARLPPAFEPGGIVTAGNASAVVDGAAAMVIGLERDVVKEGLRPLARVAGVGVAGCDPRIMGWGPVPATRIALERAGIQGKDVDVVELNEAFASQVVACLVELGVDWRDEGRVNPNGGAIALGHPLGASGARLAGTAAFELARKGRRYALVTMCIGVGQGIATVLERVDG